VNKPASVAQPSSLSSELIPPNETNPLYDNIKENQLLLLNDGNNLKKGRIYLIELFSRVENISGPQKYISTYLYFLEKGCSFAKDLQKGLGQPRQTTYRTIQKLLDNGFIFPITKTDIHRRDGPKTTLYGVEDVTQDEIERESIQFSKIVSLAKRQGGNGFYFLDIADHVARKHSMNGIKVWK
jgi:hypothetical protein